MWACSNCGEEIVDEFEVCWKCGTSRTGERDADFVTADQASAPKEPSGGRANYPIETETQHPEDAKLSTEQAIAQILQFQRQLKATLDTVSFRVGCLFAWLILGIVFS